MGSLMHRGPTHQPPSPVQDRADLRQEEGAPPQALSVHVGRTHSGGRAGWTVRRGLPCAGALCGLAPKGQDPVEGGASATEPMTEGSRRYEALHEYTTTPL
uniref:Uncharacterized protein n=1 Tax=Arundo donax TaxID=35708 RepID=A0A0A9H3J7_ARUDO